jgi:hypothetical protein
VTDHGDSGLAPGKGREMGKGKDIAGESWDVEGDIETVRQKWAQFTTLLRYTPAATTNASDAWLGWVRPETEGEDEQILFEQVTPGVTRVNVAIIYDDDDLREEGAAFTDVARRLDQDMALFKDYAEGRLPEGWPATGAS